MFNLKHLKNLRRLCLQIGRSSREWRFLKNQRALNHSNPRRSELNLRLNSFASPVMKDFSMRSLIKSTEEHLPVINKEPRLLSKNWNFKNKMLRIWKLNKQARLSLRSQFLFSQILKHKRSVTFAMKCLNQESYLQTTYLKSTHTMI